MKFETGGGSGDKPKNHESKNNKENKNKKKKENKKTQLYNSDSQESKTKVPGADGLSPNQLAQVEAAVEEENFSEISLFSEKDNNYLADELGDVLTQEKVVTRVYDSSERKVENEAEKETVKEAENEEKKEEDRPLSKDIEYLQSYQSQEENIPILKNFNIGRTVEVAKSIVNIQDKLDDYLESRYKELSKYDKVEIDNVKSNEELELISNNILQQKKSFENVFKELLPSLKSARNKAIKKAKSLELLFNKLKNVNSKDSDDNVKKHAIRNLQNTNVTLYYDISNIINSYKNRRLMFEHQADRIKDLSFVEDEDQWEENQESFQEIMEEGESVNKLLQISRVLKMLKLHYGEINNTILEKLQNKDEIDTMRSEGLSLKEVLGVIKDYDLDELYSAVTDMDYGEYHKVYDPDHSNTKSRVREVDSERLQMLKDFANKL